VYDVRCTMYDVKCTMFDLEYTSQIKHHKPKKPGQRRIGWMTADRKIREDY